MGEGWVREGGGGIGGDGGGSHLRAVVICFRHVRNTKKIGKSEFSR